MLATSSLTQHCDSSDPLRTALKTESLAIMPRSFQSARYCHCHLCHHLLLDRPGGSDMCFAYPTRRHDVSYVAPQGQESESRPRSQCVKNAKSRENKTLGSNGMELDSCLTPGH